MSRFSPTTALHTISTSWPYAISHAAGAIADYGECDQVLTGLWTDYDKPDGTAVREYIHIADLSNVHNVCDWQGKHPNGYA